jgi:hypothetical protein
MHRYEEIVRKRSSIRDKSVYLARSQPDQPGAPEQARQLTPAVVAPKPATPECSKLTSSRLAFPTRLGSLRSFQNPAVYDVVVYSNGIPVGAIAPCSESVLSLPRGDVKLKAIATVPEENGQREVEAALGLNDKLTGWQVLPQSCSVSTADLYNVSCQNILRHIDLYAVRKTVRLSHGFAELIKALNAVAVRVRRPFHGRIRDSR